jgi:hypothetical protein
MPNPNVNVDHSQQGTVLLAVNVSFLAIASVDNGSGGSHKTHSAIQVLSYASTLASTGSIFMSLQVARKNYLVKALDSTEDAVSVASPTARVLTHHSHRLDS